MPNDCPPGYTSEEWEEMMAMRNEAILENARNLSNGLARHDRLSCDSENCLSGCHKAADGSIRKIEDLEVNQELWAPSHDEPGGAKRKCRIARVFHNDPKPTIIVRFDNGLEIQGTAEHPLWVPDQGWVPVGHLQVGDACVDPNGRPVKVASKQLVEEPQPVYNIEVEGCHTYYVGKNGQYVLVHNDCKHGSTYSADKASDLMKMIRQFAENERQEIQYKKGKQAKAFVLNSIHGSNRLYYKGLISLTYTDVYKQNSHVMNALLLHEMISIISAAYGGGGEYENGNPEKPTGLHNFALLAELAYLHNVAPSGLTKYRASRLEHIHSSKDSQNMLPFEAELQKLRDIYIDLQVEKVNKWFGCFVVSS